MARGKDTGSNPNRQVNAGRFRASQSNSGYTRGEFTGRRRSTIRKGGEEEDDEPDLWNYSEMYRLRHGYEPHETWER